MKRWILVVVIAAILTVAVQGLTESNPGVESLISPKGSARGGREGAGAGASLLSREEMKRLFNADRKRLGEDFRSNLLRHVGRDVERHYICAQFLLDEKDLELKPEPELALLILAQGISIAKTEASRVGRDEEAVLDSSAEIFSLAIVAAVESSKIGFLELARHFKGEAVQILREKPVVAGARPALNLEDTRVYDGIKVVEPNGRSNANRK